MDAHALHVHHLCSDSLVPRIGSLQPRDTCTTFAQILSCHASEAFNPVNVHAAHKGRRDAPFVRGILHLSSYNDQYKWPAELKGIKSKDRMAAVRRMCEPRAITRGANSTAASSTRSDAKPHGRASSSQGAGPLKLSSKSGNLGTVRLAPNGAKRQPAVDLAIKPVPVPTHN